MKLRKFTCLAVAFLMTVTVFSQLPSWETSFDIPYTEFHPFGVLLEKDNSFISINSGIFAEVDHYGYAQKKFTLPNGFFGNPYYMQYFFFEKVDAPGDVFYLAANRLSFTSNHMYLHTVFEDGTIGLTEYLLDDNLLNHLKKGPAALKTNDGDFVIFGNENYYKVSVEDAVTINTLWTKPGNFGLIADADHYNDGFILCNEDGYLVHLDENGEPVWSQNLGLRLMAVQTTSDGFVLCGQVDDESALIKTDFSGNIIWQKTYGDSIAYDLTVSATGEIVFTGVSNDLQVFGVKTDAAGNEIWHYYYGNEIWHYYYGNGQGRKILESRYGGFLIQGKESNKAVLKRIDNDGLTGERFFFEVGAPRRIHANKISAMANAAGKHFGPSSGWGTNAGGTYSLSISRGYLFPKNEETSTISSGGLWMAGLDDEGEIHFAGSYVAQELPTPSYPFQGGYIGADPLPWERDWSVNRQMIEIVRNDLADGVKDLTWAEDMITWPGKGNPNFIFNGEQVEIPVDMAPFVDVNGDGIYNVYDGDYPEIKGDQMLWWAMNDQTDRPPDEGLPFGIQVFCSFYSIGCVDDDLIDQTTFLEMDIQNVSENDYTDFYMGWLSLLRIGCWEDNYVGSIPDVNAVYAYNADEADGNQGTCENNLHPFQGQPPIQTAIVLNHDMSTFMTFNHVGVTPPPPPGTENPIYAVEYHRYLKAIFRDGIPMTVGGNGHNLSSTDYTKIAFPGNPAFDEGWSGCADTLDLLYRAMLMSPGPMSLQAREQLSLKIAYLTLTDIPQPCPDSDLIASRITELKNIYDVSDFRYSLDLGPDITIEQGETITLNAGLIAGATYLWNSGESSSSIDVSTPGIYVVTVTTPWGCEFTDEVEVSVTISDKDIVLSTLKVYPNPANDRIYIELNNDVPEMIHLENIIGRRLKTVQVSSGSENQTLEIYTDLTTGIYLIRFEYHDKETMQKLVVIR